MKQTYVKITIEASSYAAKAAADNYCKNRQYVVLSRSKPYPSKVNSNVKIHLRVIKKTQLGYNHKGGWDTKKSNKQLRNRISKIEETDYKHLMMQPY